ADIYLWQEKYDDCLKMCDTVLNSGRFEFVEDGEQWFYLIFEEKYGTESVFELEYNTTTAAGDNSKIRSTNNFLEWCITKTHFVPGETIVDLYKEVTGINDLRGGGASIAEFGSVLRLAKYAAFQSGSVMTARSYGNANWIFYRVSDLLLMKAEALAMMQRYQESVDIVNKIRKRAGYLVDLSATNSELLALELVMQERRRELLMEGKRWFDVVRMAKKKDYQYKSYLIDVVLQGVSAAQRPRYESLLANPLSWYLPILQKQIDDNTGVLEQNPYYANEN
ncbi:MAG: RagB/SusD family nutrient uptake outer membrane protein, partial [Culturomica sp.]|nr:RagB/SusD family nutrient uptake outer membrane protein [Culturomica sp.]